MGADDRLIPVLEEARARGFLGPGPVEAHIAHAQPLIDALPAEGTVVDLGSGGGIPGLVIAVARPALTCVLVEAQRRRADWLERAARELGAARVEVLAERAEVTGRGAWRGAAAAVVSRSFGPPAVTAECAAPLLVIGGYLWVAEPPAPSLERWPGEGLAELGLGHPARRAGGWVGLPQLAVCPERYPRRPGIPAKRPLF